MSFERVKRNLTALGFLVCFSLGTDLMGAFVAEPGEEKLVAKGAEPGYLKKLKRENLLRRGPVAIKKREKKALPGTLLARAVKLSSAPVAEATAKEAAHRAEKLLVRKEELERGVPLWQIVVFLAVVAASGVAFWRVRTRENG